MLTPRFFLQVNTVFFVLLVIVFHRPAVAQPTSESPGTPNYDLVLRQDEDWSAFDKNASDSIFGRIKKIDLNEDGTSWLTIGGSFRTRVEAWNNFGFQPAADDTFLLTRLRLHADIQLGPAARVFVEGKSAFSTDRNLPGGQRTLDTDSLALQQAFVDITLIDEPDLGLTIRPGRQMLRFGRQRLISPLPWGNTLRTWDGVSAEIRMHDWVISPFWAQFVPVQKYDFNDSDHNQQLYGVYASGPLSLDGVRADAYFIGLDDDNPGTFNGTTGSEERYTIGGRLHGSFAPSLSFDLEGAYQFGEIGGGDINAYMIAAELKYAIPNSALASSVFIGFDYASGDDGAGGDVETFNQLFPLGHAYLGAIDVIGRQNVVSGHLGFAFKPAEAWTLSAKGFAFFRADDSDAVYNAGGGVLVPGGASGDAYVGSEIDLRAIYRFNKHTSFESGYSHFFAGDAIDNGLIQSSDIDFVYAQLTIVF